MLPLPYNLIDEDAYHGNEKERDGSLEKKSEQSENPG